MSFANEVKDFLGSYVAVTEMGGKKKDREQRAKRDEANTAYQEAIIEIQREGLELRKQAEAARQRLATNKAAGTKVAGLTTDAAAAALDGIDMSGFDLKDMPGFEEEEETPAFNMGGLVDEEKPEEAVAPAPVAPEALPTISAPTRPPAMPARRSAPAPEAPAAPATNPDATRIVVEKAREIGKDIMDTVEYELKTPTSAVGEGANKIGADFVAGKGGMTPTEVTSIEKQIDSEGQIPPHLKTAVTMAELHRHFADRGDAERATKAAVGYLTGVKGLTQTLGALSMTAAQEGDPVAACRLANDACNRFPSGHEISFSPDPRNGFNYVVKNEGEVVEQGRMNPNEFIEFGGKIANGQLFTEQMMQFVSTYQKTGGSYSKALTGIEESAARLAGIQDAMADMDESEEGYAALAAAEKETRAALASAEAVARDTATMRTPKSKRTVSAEGGVESAIRAARSAGMKMAIPFEMPAGGAPEESEGRGFFGAIGDGVSRLFSGPIGQVDPNASASSPAAAPAPVTPAGNLKAPPPDVAQRARAAIANGASVDKVVQRLREAGFSDEGL